MLRYVRSLLLRCSTNCSTESQSGCFQSGSPLGICPALFRATRIVLSCVLSIAKEEYSISERLVHSEISWSEGRDP